MGLSPQHYLAVERAPGAGSVGIVLEQAVGFLYAQGAAVLRVNLRCPLAWFQDSSGKLAWRKCLLFFARHFLAEDPTQPPYVPPNVWRVAKISFVAEAGRHYWHAVEQICEGLEAEDPALLLELGTALTTMAGRWERYLVREIALGEKHSQYDVEARDAVARCDRQFYQLVTRFEPGYELLPTTVARLL